MEQWTVLEKYPPYEVSSCGRVRGKTGNILSPGKTARGYVRVSFTVDRKVVSLQVHRLVAEAFIPNPDNKPVVDHANRVRDDNRVENLRWCSLAENRANRPEEKPGENHGRGRKVVELTPEGLFVRVWDSIAQASREKGQNSAHICNCCRGNRKTSRGSGWAYLDDYETQDPDETWRSVTVREKEFTVSSLGRVKYNTGKITGGFRNGNYLAVPLGTGSVAVHRLVALAFPDQCPKKEGQTEVNHINGVKTDNSIGNLEWVTPSENIRHAVSTGLRKVRGVYSIDSSGAIEHHFSVADAARRTKTHRADIYYAAAKGTWANGRKWAFAEEYEKNGEEFSLEDVYPPEPVPDDDPIWDELGL